TARAPGGGGRIRSCSVRGRVAHPRTPEGGAPFGALRASPAVPKTARPRAGQGQRERQIAAATDHRFLGEATKRGADRQARRERPAGDPAESREEGGARVGKRVVREQRQRDRRNAPPRAVDRCEAAEEQVPSGQV